MVEGDVASALSLSQLAGWNQTQEDWKLFLNISPTGCFVAVDDTGDVQGTVATVRYEHHFSWIGMVLVHTTMQRRGVGTMLLRRALDELSDEETIKLDATPAGRQLYLSLGFRDEYRLLRMELVRVSPSQLDTSSRVRALQTEDLFKLMEFDHQVFGANRRAIVEAIWRRAPEFAFILENAGVIRGYCFGRWGERFTHIGPVVANDLDGARNLCSAALMNAPARPVVIDALSEKDSWLGWLNDIGFREQRPLIRMYRGSNEYPGLPEKQFAILGPEFG